MTSVIAGSLLRVTQLDTDGLPVGEPITTTGHFTMRHEEAVAVEQWEPLEDGVQHTITLHFGGPRPTRASRLAWRKFYSIVLGYSYTAQRRDRRRDHRQHPTHRTNRRSPK